MNAYILSSTPRLQDSTTIHTQLSPNLHSVRATMKYATFLSLAIVAAQVAHTSANSACSSGLYAALAPLDNYPPAVSYCKAQAGKATVIVSATAKKIRRIPRTTSATSSGPTASTASGTTLKTTTTSSSKDAKASSWSSLVAQAKQVVATFCSCAGYPATITVC